MRRVLVTGARGALGSALARELKRQQVSVVGADVADFDIRDRTAVPNFVAYHRPTLIFHLAAAKHAPEGEIDPWNVTETNVFGTLNILDTGVRTILASTCKAADPETVYGASKLIAERMTLASGGSVARFYNIRETGGNVFEYWRTLPEEAPVPVTDCFRHFVSLERAVELLLWTIDQPPGRYTLRPDTGNWMWDIAHRTYPGRRRVMVPRRRGDRRIEPLMARSETLEHLDNGFARIVSAHDAAPIREALCA